MKKEKKKKARPTRSRGRRPVSGDILYYAVRTQPVLKIMLDDSRALCVKLLTGDSGVALPYLHSDADGPLGGHVIVGHLPKAELTRLAVQFP